MAQKTMNATIVVGGRVDNSFGRIGTVLANVGAQVDEVSRKLINFGKESLETYRGYEDSMLDAQVALSTSYGRGTQALKQVMDTLDAQATEWAASTIFHTDDVANAIAEAAHANWDLDKILTGIPAAMRLAQAGGLDLSTSVDYIVKSTNAAGISFQDLDGWIDQWTFAANSSAADVQTLGEAMLRMGSTMKFAKNTEELLTLLAVLHDAGTTGANAGTLLRNSMIRILAPTDKASKTMKTLGVTMADIDEAMGEVDGDTMAAMQRLHELGFSAYDEQGNLKGILEIFQDLAIVTQKMEDDERYKTLAAIFPTRSITGALAFLDAAANGWNGLYEAMQGGAAEGYGKYGADVMMSGLTGSIETFLSKWERLKQVTGAEIAPEAETILGNFGKLIDVLAGGGENNGISAGLGLVESFSNAVGNFADNLGKMDPALFDALVEGLGTIAVLGPGIGMAGFAFSTLGWALGTPTGRIALAALAISALATGINKFREAKFQEAFGDLEINTEGLDAKMAQIRNEFEKSSAPTERFAQALRTSINNYKEASATFSATMMEDLLADQTLTGKDLEKKLKEYEGLGEKMVNALKEGITNSAGMSAEFWKMVVTGNGSTEEGNALLEGLTASLDAEKSGALATATAIGEQMKKAITEAWGDGTLDEEERQKIKEYFRQLNEAIAEAEREAKDEEDYIARVKMMDKAQGMDYGQMQQYIDETILPQRQAEIDSNREYYLGEIARRTRALNGYQKEYDALMAQGRFEEAWAIGSDITREQNVIAGMKSEFSKYVSGIYGIYNGLIADWYTATGNDSDFGDQIPGLMQAAELLTSGTSTDINSLISYAESLGSLKDWGALEEYYKREVEALGGVEEMKKNITTYTESGDADLLAMADNLKSILAAYSILTYDLSPYADLLSGRQQTAADFAKLVESGYFADEVAEYFEALRNGETTGAVFDVQNDWMNEVVRGWFDTAAGDLGQKYNLDWIADEMGKGLIPDEYRRDFAMAQLLGMNERQRSEWLLGSAGSNLYNAERELAGKQAELADYQDWFYNSPAGMFHEGMKDGEILRLEAEVAAAEGTVAEAREAAQAEIDGQEPLEEEMIIPNGADAARTAAEEAQAQADAMEISFKATMNVETVYGGAIITGGKSGGLFSNLGFSGIVNPKIPHKAEGGREDRPTIFAEAGIPEWYIPEEHTENTARLILSAARASGFTLADLAAASGARFFANGGTDGTGSLSAALDWGHLSGGSAESGDISVQYSPVIHGGNGENLNQTLREDKERLRQFFLEFMEDQRRYQDMVRYA